MERFNISSEPVTPVADASTPGGASVVGLDDLGLEIRETLELSESSAPKYVLDSGLSSGHEAPLGGEDPFQLFQMRSLTENPNPPSTIPVTPVAAPMAQRQEARGPSVTSTVAPAARREEYRVLQAKPLQPANSAQHHTHHPAAHSSAGVAAAGLLLGGGFVAATPAGGAAAMGAPAASVAAGASDAAAPADEQ